MIDLRSDTITKPSAEMLSSIKLDSLREKIGDDVFKEDKITNEFEHQIADLLGKESALFVTSGTMANQLGVRLNTTDGDEVILESGSHIFNYESVAPAILSRVQLRPIEGTNGIIKSEQISEAIRPHADWYPNTSLVTLENTHNRAGGIIYPLIEIERISELCKSKNLKLHLDGARLWNACSATGIAPKEYAQHFDTVAVCFSKGLGAPIGSAICGTSAAITKARRFRKMWGGGMRQTGILTSMAKFAIEHNYEKLKEDHSKAKLLADAFSRNPKFRIDLANVQTNIVSVEIATSHDLIHGSNQSEENVIAYFRSKGILISSIRKNFVRLVSHLDVSLSEIQIVANAIKNY